MFSLGVTHLWHTQKMTKFMTCSPHLQKWRTGLLFKNNRIHKLETNFKTIPPSFPSGCHTQPTQKSSRRLKKVTTSCDQTRHRHDVWKKTSNLQRLEDVWFTSSWRRQICDVLKTSDLLRLQDVWSTTFWRRPIYFVLKTSNYERLEDV